MDVNTRIYTDTGVAVGDIVQLAGYETSGLVLTVNPSDMGQKVIEVRINNMLITAIESQIEGFDDE